MKFSYNRKDGYCSSRVNVSFLTMIVMNKREREEEEEKNRIRQINTIRRKR